MSQKGADENESDSESADPADPCGHHIVDLALCAVNMDFWKNPRTCDGAADSSWSGCADLLGQKCTDGLGIGLPHQPDRTADGSGRPADVVE